MNINYMEAIERRRQIEGIYFGLSRIHQECLLAIFASLPAPGHDPTAMNRIKSDYGKLAPLVVYLHPIRKPKEKEVYEKEANKLYTEAVETYYQLRKNVQYRKV